MGSFFFFFWGGGGVRVDMNVYAPNRCEPSIEVIMKMGVQCGVFFFWGGGGGQGGYERERKIEGGCERRIKVFVKMHKKMGVGSGQM